MAPSTLPPVSVTPALVGRVLTPDHTAAPRTCPRPSGMRYAVEPPGSAGRVRERRQDLLPVPEQRTEVRRALAHHQPRTGEPLGEPAAVARWCVRVEGAVPQPGATA